MYLCCHHVTRASLPSLHPPPLPLLPLKVLYVINAHKNAQNVTATALYRSGKGKALPLTLIDNLSLPGHLPLCRGATYATKCTNQHADNTLCPSHFSPLSTFYAPKATHAAYAWWVFAGKGKGFSFSAPLGTVLVAYYPVNNCSACGMLAQI